jgi:uncharacterized caspase-like protein
MRTQIFQCFPIVCRAALFFIVLASQSQQAWAEKRIALVIGNAAYQNTPPLPNPRNDATDLAAELTGLGFQVIQGLDLDRAAMNAKIAEFADALGGADVGLFYYGGHALQFNGRNYLIPVDAKLATSRSLEFETVQLDSIQGAMEGDVQTNIIFLDACRDNPIARNLASSLRTRGLPVHSGLAQVEAGVGTLISFSTQPGAVAFDGDGRNSPFTSALVKHIKDEAPITDILISVRNDVLTATKQQQVPWDHSSLRAQFYFKQPSGVAAPSGGESAALDQQTEHELWRSIMDSKNPAVLQSYVDQYPSGRYARSARILIDRLKEKEAQEPQVNLPGAPSTDTTVAALTHDATRSTGTPTEVSPPEALASDIQQQLKRVGCYREAVDGKWGENTRAALRQFASETKISISAKEPTPDALTILKASKEGACAQSRTVDEDSKQPSTKAEKSPKRRQARSQTERTRQPERPSRGGGTGTVIFGVGKGVGIGIGF